MSGPLAVENCASGDRDLAFAAGIGREVLRGLNRASLTEFDRWEAGQPSGSPRPGDEGPDHAAIKKLPSDVEDFQRLWEPLGSIPIGENAPGILLQACAASRGRVRGRVGWEAEAPLTVERIQKADLRSIAWSSQNGSDSF